MAGLEESRRKSQGEVLLGTCCFFWLFYISKSLMTLCFNFNEKVNLAFKKLASWRNYLSFKCFMCIEGSQVHVHAVFSSETVILEYGPEDLFSVFLLIFFHYKLSNLLVLELFLLFLRFTRYLKNWKFDWNICVCVCVCVCVWTTFFLI